MNLYTTEKDSPVFDWAASSLQETPGRALLVSHPTCKETLSSQKEKGHVGPFQRTLISVGSVETKMGGAGAGGGSPFLVSCSVKKVQYTPLPLLPALFCASSRRR